MGCMWSSEGRPTLRCKICGRKAVNNLIVIDNMCEICISILNRKQNSAEPKHLPYCVIQLNNTTNGLTLAPSFSKGGASAGPLYGEYRCPCGRSWNSRLSWANAYQVCKHCRRQVTPRNQRALRPADRAKDTDKLQEHPQELCHKCKTLGYYCCKMKRNHKF